MIGQNVVRIGQPHGAGATTRRSTINADYQFVPRPISAMPKDFPAGARSGIHSHPRGQLLFCCAGVMEVTASTSVWLVPPQRALWVPIGIDHEVRCRGAVSLRTIYVAPSVIPADWPCRPTVVRVSPLLRELILRAVTMPILYDESGPDGLVAQLLLSEFEWERSSLLSLQTPSDPRLGEMYWQLIDDPRNALTLEEWAERLALTPRTLARRINAETGTSFVTWRKQIRLLAALPRLAQGENVLSVALDVGYETSSAFCRMFKELTGSTPSAYFSASP